MFHPAEIACTCHRWHYVRATMSLSRNVNLHGNAVSSVLVCPAPARILLVGALQGAGKSAYRRKWQQGQHGRSQSRSLDYGQPCFRATQTGEANARIHQSITCYNCRHSDPHGNQYWHRKIQFPHLSHRAGKFHLDKPLSSGQAPAFQANVMYTTALDIIIRSCHLEDVRGLEVSGRRQVGKAVWALDVAGGCMLYCC